MTLTEIAGLVGIVDPDIGTILTGVGTVGGLASVVAGYYWMQRKRKEAAEQKIEQDKAKTQELSVEIARAEGKVEVLESKTADKVVVAADLNATADALRAEADKIASENKDATAAHEIAMKRASDEQAANIEKMTINDIAVEETEIGKIDDEFTKRGF